MSNAPTNHSRKYYVYEHYRSDTGACFYVGKGHGRRAYEMRWRKNVFHENVVSFLKTNGFEVQVHIVSDCLTESEAFALEIDRIAFWTRLGTKLTNCTTGGEGISGHKHSEIVKNLIRKTHTGVKFTDERRAKIGAKLKGRKFSAETLARMSVSQKARAQKTADWKKGLEKARLVVWTPESKAKQRAATALLRGIPKSRAHVEKVVASRRRNKLMTQGTMV